MTAKTYDSSCYDLGALFLGDEPDLHTPERCHELACLIQTTIEDFIASERDAWAEANSQFGVGA